MKKMIILFSILLLITSCNQATRRQTTATNNEIVVEQNCDIAASYAAQQNRLDWRQNPLLIDLDNDQINDSIFFDDKNKIIIVKLSSQQFRPIKSQHIEIATTRIGVMYSNVFEMENGFEFRNNFGREGHTHFFEYNSQTNRIQLVKMNRETPLLSWGGGDSSVNLVTGEYIGTFYLFDAADSLRSIPIRAQMRLGTVYLEDFSSAVYLDYEEKCLALFEIYREKLLQKIDPEPPLDIEALIEMYKSLSTPYLYIPPYCDIIFETADKMPQFPGGNDEMFRFIGQNLRFPNTDANVQGNVILQFVVRKDGTITDIEVVRSPYPPFSREAIRVVEAMPRWIPGEHNGEKVNVRFRLPVRFQLAA